MQDPTEIKDYTDLLASQASECMVVEIHGVCETGNECFVDDDNPQFYSAYARHQDGTSVVIFDAGKNRLDTLRSAVATLCAKWGWTSLDFTQTWLTTYEILQAAKLYSLEVSLALAGGFKSTHFITSNGMDLFADEGCDSYQMECTEEAFLEQYPDRLGKIWMITQKTLRVSTVIAKADITENGFNLSQEKELSFKRLFPYPNKKLPASFSDAVRLLTRPYYPITDELFKEIMSVTKSFNTDIVVDENGRQMTFGNADGVYQLMPLMKKL